MQFYYTCRKGRTGMSENSLGTLTDNKKFLMYRNVSEEKVYQQ